MTIAFAAMLFLIAVACYLVATVAYLRHLVRGGDGTAGRTALLAGLAVHTVSLVVRGLAAGRLPFLNYYEYLVAFTWGAVIVYLVLESVTRQRAVGAFAVPLVTAFAGLAALLPTEVNPTPEVLRNAWSVPHIGSAVLAYGAFLVAAMLAVIYLLRERAAPGTFLAQRLPTADVVDHVTYRTIAFGFLMQTLVIIVGAIWAQVAWGRFWGWDPKETWSLVTWLIYAVYLHTRTTLGWQGRRSAWLALGGFAATLFTLVGVTFLMHGLHSYAGTPR
jgi:cytochrome c-type biogenesis protein CcsB